MSVLSPWDHPECASPFRVRLNRSVVTVLRPKALYWCSFPRRAESRDIQPIFDQMLRPFAFQSADRLPQTVQADW